MNKWFAIGTSSRHTRSRSHDPNRLPVTIACRPKPKEINCRIVKDQLATLTPEGPAERAGLRGFKIVRERRRQGPFVMDFERVDRSGADLIVAVAGQPVRTADDFLSAVESKNPGDQVLISVRREGHQLDVPVVLDAEK